MSWEDAKEALKKNEEIKITFVGRKSKKKVSTPVWYVFENNSILLLEEIKKWYSGFDVAVRVRPALSK
ncbi:MAG: hypothetical protein ACPLN2_01590 [Thermoproteota archaeon]